MVEIYRVDHQLETNFIMLKTARFSEIQNALGNRLMIIDATLLNSILYYQESFGLLATLKLFCMRPEAVWFEKSSGNMTRKLIRFPRLGSLQFIKRTYHRVKAIEASLKAHYIKSYLRNYPNFAAIIHNGTNAPDSILEHLSDPKRRLFIENGYFKNTYQIDPLGVNADSSIPRNPQFYRSLSFQKPNKKILSPVRQTKHKSDEAILLPSTFIFVPFQVESDMQITKHSPWIKDMKHYYQVVHKLAECYPQLNFVIKEHPNTRRIISKNLPKHDRIIFQNGRDTKELIELSSAVMTLNSTVGIEAIVASKKVFVLANATYAISGLVLIARNFIELKSCIEALPDWEIDTKIQASFLDYIMANFLFGEGCQPIDDTLFNRLISTFDTKK